MMQVLLVGYNISESEKVTLDKIGKYLTDTYKIVDLMSYDLSSTTQDVLVVFGGRANRLSIKSSHMFREEFPEPCYLSATSGNEEERQVAAERLKQIKRRLSLPVSDQMKKEQTKYIIKPEDLPDLTTTEILGQLQTTLVRQEAKEWLGWSKNGKTVRLTVEPEEGNADINLTFAELFTLRTAMDILQVNEVEIVPRSAKQTNSKNSTR